MLSSVNGEFSSNLSLVDRGLAYGDGVFETMRLVNGSVPLWSYHRQRLLRGCERLCILFNASSIEESLQSFLNVVRQTGEETAGVIKIIVTRGRGGRGYGVEAGVMPTVVLQLLPAVDLISAPLELDICSHRLPSNPLLAGIKHLNRLDNVMLSIECQQRGAEDGLALDRDDHVIETTTGNLFFEIGGCLRTPSVEHCGVAGVMRQFIIEELAKTLGLEVIIARISLRNLDDYDAAFCGNSVRGIRPLLRIAQTRLQPGPIFESLQRSLKESRFATPH